LRNYGQLPLGLQTFSEARIGATPSKVKRTRKHIDEVMSHTFGRNSALPPINVLTSRISQRALRGWEAGLTLSLRPLLENRPRPGRCCLAYLYSFSRTYSFSRIDYLELKMA